MWGSYGMTCIGAMECRDESSYGVRKSVNRTNTEESIS